MEEEHHKKRKILYVITKGNFGGAQKYVHDLAVSLPKDRFYTLVACGTKNGTTLKEKVREKGIETIDLESSEREISLKKDFKTLKDLINLIKKEKPDIIHLNSSKIGFLGALSVLFLKFYSKIHNTYSIPHSVFTSHGWAFNEKNRSNFSKIIFYLAHYATVLICDKTIAVSSRTKSDISWLPFIDKKIEVIHNGIEYFETKKREDSRKILDETDSGKKIIISLSELHNNKGIDIALKAISMLSEEYKEKIKYCIVGDGEEKSELLKLAKNLKVETCVNFLGFYKNARELLSGADIFLLPSRTENLPFSLLEAGFVGLPVICTNVGGNSEVIKDMQNGILVHPRNSKEIKEAILYLLDHPEKEEEFANEIRKTITNFFSFERTLKKTEDLYNSLN